MVIYFICRGNVFRSMIAETYLRSLNIPNVTVLSGGTVASRYRESNARVYPEIRALLKNHGIEKYMKNHYGDDVEQRLLDTSDRVICLNSIIYDELRASFKVPDNTEVWNVADVDETGRVIEAEEDREAFRDGSYELIIKNVDALVASWAQLK